VGVALIMAWWANNSRRDKIIAFINRENGTEIKRSITMKAKFIQYKGKRWDVVWTPQTITWFWADQGLLNSFFPHWEVLMNYTWSSRFPLDKKTGKPTIISPAVRNSMNKEEWVGSYAKGFTPPSSKKQTMIQQYLPWIAVIGVVIVGVYFYTNMSAIAQHVQSIENMQRAITK